MFVLNLRVASNGRGGGELKGEERGGDGGIGDLIRFMIEGGKGLLRRTRQ
jgi:hypothetical protein